MPVTNGFNHVATLTTDIEHAVRKIADDEGSFGDTSRLDTRSEHVLVVGNVVGRGDTVDGVEVAAAVSGVAHSLHGACSLFSGVVELVLARALEALLDTGVLPQD